MTERRQHWNEVYAKRPIRRLGWYKARLHISLDWIAGLGLAPHDRVIDVGAGASTLVDDLLEMGHQSITILDISEHALVAVRDRLGDRAAEVECVVGDVTDVELPDSGFALWHDRAAFHFLTDARDRRKYRDRLTAALRTGGHLVIGTFAPEAPEKCSGLPVRRYDLQQLVVELGSEFDLLDDCKELHVTPGGVEQMYQFALLRFLDEGRS